MFALYNYWYIYIMTTNFKVNGRDINTIFSAAGSADTSNNTLTNYTNNNSILKFFKPFYAGISTTANETTFNGDSRMYATANFLTNSANTRFCPPYAFYGGNANNSTNFTAGTTASSTVTPPSGVTRMLVLLVGGGGGGGGGGSKSGGGAGGGGGGGSGGISIFSINYTSGTYTVNVGYGGIYGYTSGNQANGPGDEDGTGPNFAGYGGGAGVDTSFNYSGITYTANGGFGGGGGAGGGGGTTGPAANANSTNAIYSYTGVAGSAGSYGSTPNPGGAGGKPKYGDTININLINLVSAQTQKNSNNVNPTRYLQYGEGGNGGKGDNTSTYGWNGEFGAPGCAIVFYFYN